MPAARRPRILIVDDEVDSRVLLREVLEAEGFAIVGEAGDAETAVRLATELAPCVVLMDLVMPGVDALEATATIQETTSRAIVVILTAYEALLPAAEKVGAFAYLVKGDSPQLMVDVLRQAWGRLMER